ncbi:hypothetical protein CKO25_11550 [Thiocapsa imhoffii]|uniref:Lipoprotein n=1 Tax=Thiocapsa imhoffii TaxID=382777 RepID=A0A9X0WJ62_9GAMM|nr:hypothetical protein [Thiocapsa imhoffii]MBK1645264.1 hypothetical protein [Thiocapsa imhoffii]
MTRLPLVVALSILASGCALIPPTHFGGIATSVSAMDYAEQLCSVVELEAYATCLNEMLDDIDQRGSHLPAGFSTSGPFAVILGGEVYLGSYRSSPFAAAFQVTSGERQCRGGYSAFHGSADAVFDVHCDDGRSGWADTVRALDGRNGIGTIKLDDGTEGRIVFGYLPLGDVERWSRPD